MKFFYWYSGAVVVLFFLVLAGVIVYSFSRNSNPGDNGGLVTLVALAGPAVAAWLIALGWVALIFYRKFIVHDAELSQTTFIIAIVLALIVLKSPFDAYRNFFPDSASETSEK